MQNTVNVDIAIQNVSLTQQGFGTPMFLTPHNFTNGRVLEVSSTAELIELGFPATHDAVYATHQFLRNSPSVNTVKIGRVSSSIPMIISNVPETPTNLVIHVVTPNSSTLDSITISASTETHTANEIATEFAQGFNADINNGLTASAVGNVVTLTPVDPETVFRVLKTNTFIDEGEPTNLEDGLSVLEHIRDEDDDFYFLSSSVKCFRPVEIRFCEQLAAAVEGTDKLYFTSTSSPADLDLTVGAFARTVFENGYRNTICLFHQNADSESLADSYPECYYIGYNAPYLAGSVTWSNLRVALPQSEYQGRKLTTAQKNRLDSNNIAYVEIDNGLNILKGGKVSNGEWIDVVRGVHWLKSDFTTSLKALLYSQQGGKVPYTNVGVGRVREVCQSSLQRAVNRGFLDSYTLTVPLVNQINPQDWQNRVLSGIRFTGVLTGAIHSINVMGSVTTPSTN